MMILQTSSFAQNQLYYPRQTMALSAEYDIENYLKNYLPFLQKQEVNLHMTFKKQTPFSFHYTFEVTYKEIALLDALIKVNADKHGNIISIKTEGLQTADLFQLNVENEIQAWNQINISQLALNYWPANYRIAETKFVIIQQNNFAEVGLLLNSWDRHHDNTLILDREGKKVVEYNQLRYANKDSLVKLRVFLPDPLTKANQVYGGIYKDLSDANSVWMNTTYVDTSAMATYDDLNQIFYLENEWVKVADLESPAADPATNSMPEFYFDRSHTGFEDANAFFHITNYHNYISSLGYDTLMDIQLEIDTHGQFGADNSVFNRNGGNPNIMYGTGGVDDAEDADVVIHEYSHALSWDANNNGNFSNERGGLDEGIADYFAMSYSRNINSFNWDKIFSWDGHNEFWGGRTATTSTNYPPTGNIYAIGEVWNAAMSNIWTDLGPIITDKLMLEALHFLTPQSTLPEAATYILQADTLLFNGIHSQSICTHFKNKQIFDQNCLPVGIAKVETPQLFQLINSVGFAQNQSDARLQFSTPTSGQLTAFDMYGKKVIQINFENQIHINIHPTAFQTGVYIFKL